MNGRIERVDARYALNSEMNYSTVDFFFAEMKREKWRTRRERLLRMAKRLNNSKLFWTLVGLAYLWFVIWGAAKGL